MDLGLNGKRALVCASSRGLGLACAERLASEGANLFLCARDGERLAREADRLATEHRVKVAHLAIDLARPENVQKLADAATSELGGIDILVNNVGGPPPSAAVDTPHEAWVKGFEQVFLSSTLLSQALVLGMRRQRFGRIITITSLSVVEPIDHLVVSTAMRAAVTTFSKTLAKEVAPDGITVNLVMPGVIETDRIVELRKARAAREGTTLEDEMAKTRATIPMKRLGRPEELADLVAFLASERASYLTGLNVPVDGGLRKGW